MRNIQKRSLSLLLVIALCLSFIVPAVQTPAAAATVSYVKDGNYVYNWGKRDEVATFLSPMAGEFYTGNNTYEKWSAMAGGTSTSDASMSDLYAALGDFMMDMHTKKTSYDDTRSLFQYTDCQSSGGKISSFYSGKGVGPAWDGGGTWNREHTWPKSKSNSESNSTGRNTDIMMLRPTSVSENSSRGNKAYGENVGTDIYDPNELGQKVRGDVARIVLYIYTRWGYDTEKHDGAQKFMWGSNGAIESLDTLLKWMAEDPVDTWEMGRNDSVQSITGTRNVFVDYPQLAFQLFGKSVPANMQVPNGEVAVPGTGTNPPTTDPEDPTPDAPVNPPAVGEGVLLDMTTESNRDSQNADKQVWKQNGITLTNDKSGSSTPVAAYAPPRFYAGSSVTVTYPAMVKLVFDCAGEKDDHITGMEASLKGITGATVTNASGVITVVLPQTMDSVTFTMTAQGRAKKLTVYPAEGTEAPEVEEYTVSFAVPTGVTAVSAQTVADGESVTLPTAGAPDAKYTFVGWAAAQVADGTAVVAELLTGSYKPRENVTLYPVYSYVEQGTGATEIAWVKTALAEIKSTDKVVITMAKGGTTWAMSQTKGSKGQPTAVTVTTSNDKLDAAPSSGLIWNITNTNNKLVIYTNGKTDNFLYCTKDNNGLRIGSTVENQGFEIKDNYLYNTNQTRYVGVYNSVDWRSYTSINNNITGQTLAFFVETEIANTGAKTYYTSANAVAPSAPDPEQPPVTPDPEDPTAVTELKTGDQVVIFAPTYNKALSVNKTGHYNVGVNITVANGEVTGYGETEIWTVTVNGDGTYSFANGGQNIGLASQYTSMNLGAENDKWELTSLGGELYNVKNTGRGTYMEWYVQYSNWSTHNPSNAATDDQFKLSFYVIGKGILGDDGTTPEQPPVEPDEPEYPEADSTLTISEAIALGTPMASNSYTPGKYYVTGVITEVYNTTYGNMRIKDDAGNILTVYGTYDATGEIRYDGLETKPVAGDQVTVYGVIGNYDGKPQMKSGWIIGHTPGVEEPPAEPVAPEFPVSDKLVTKVADLLPGTYKLAGYIWKDSDGTDISAAPFHLWNGTVNYGDLVTSSYAFADDTFTAAATDDAADVVLVGVPGKENTYYIMVGEQYLYSTESANRKLALGDEPVEWVATDNEKGGISLSSNGVFLGSANAKSKFLRSYTDETTPVFGVCFFKVNVPQPSVPIALKGYNLTLGNSLSINFNVTQEVMDQYEDVYMVFQVEGRDPVKVTEYFVRQNSDTDIRYNFAFDGVSILDLNVPVLATVYGTFNGVEYSYTAKNAVSVLSYCNSKIANGADDPETAGVCANLLKYAIAAEAYMNAQYGTATDGHLVKILTDAQLAAIETYATPDDQVSVEKTSSHTEGTKVAFSNQSLEMVSRITLRYKITILESGLDTSKLTFKVTYTDYNGNAACQDYTFEDLEHDAKTGEYVLSFSGFNATQMKALAKCTIYIDGVEHCYYANSIENYCCTAINSSTQPEVVKYLAKRISLYGDACYAAYGK